MLYKINRFINGWRYNLRAKSALKLEQRDPGDLKKDGYHSQYGQDQLVAETLLPRKRAGVFVDIGAHDGVSYNNTLFFEQNRGWTGLAIEPIPEIYKKLTAARKCTTINACVGSKSGFATFAVISGEPEMLSGLVDEYNPSHRRRIKNELASFGGTRQEIKVKTYTLNDLLEEQGIFQVDYLSIDVEGAEYSILKQVDFGRFRFGIIGVENSYQDYRIPLLLERAGFTFYAILGIDDFYVHKDFSIFGKK